MFQLPNLNQNQRQKVNQTKEEVISKEKAINIEDIEKAKLKPWQEFTQAYDALVKQYGYHIVAIPQWKQSLDTGEFSMVIQMSVRENLPEPK